MNYFETNLVIYKAHGIWIKILIQNKTCITIKYIHLLQDKFTSSTY